MVQISNNPESSYMTRVYYKYSMLVMLMAKFLVPVVAQTTAPTSIT
jgi:hypothetical protein